MATFFFIHTRVRTVFSRQPWQIFRMQAGIHSTIHQPSTGSGQLMHTLSAGCPQSAGMDASATIDDWAHTPLA